jgi:hypothetical protein
MTTIPRQCVDGSMPPELTPVLFWQRGVWRSGTWQQRADGICWQVEGSSWVDPSSWSERMERPTHWMPQPAAPNSKTPEAKPAYVPLTDQELLREVCRGGGFHVRSELERIMLLPIGRAVEAEIMRRIGVTK